MNINNECNRFIYSSVRSDQLCLIHLYGTTKWFEIDVGEIEHDMARSRTKHFRLTSCIECKMMHNDEDHFRNLKKNLVV